MEKTYKACQSCGMPFRNDSKGGGSNADGTLNKMYCSHCYEKGKFTQPEITAEQMQSFVKEKLRGMGGIHKFFAGFFSSGIQRLERWKK